MALVCDIKSDLSKDEAGRPTEDPKDEDLEDGEIEDDDEEETPGVVQTLNEPPPVLPDLTKPPPFADLSKLEAVKGLSDDKKREDKKTRHGEKKHLTEAEKSVMRLHKLERMEREKREKYRREQDLFTVCHPVEVEEDYATTLEKALAKVLKKDKPTSDEEKLEETAEDGSELSKKDKKARARKRRRRERHNKQSKKSKLDSPGKDDVDENEMLNVRGGSPGGGELQSPSQGGKSDEEDPYDSEASSDRSSQRKHGKRFEKRKYRDRSRERGEKRGGSVGGGGSASKAAKRNKGICLHYLQGHCEDENCPYSHESVQPMKMELCKFYLQECCAKGDKCLYMHSEFPCKFYHTGIPCTADNCKFAHGGPLSESLKQILFKHIETAPKEILGNFPRLSRDDASLMMAQAQANLDKLYAKKDQNSGAGEAKDSMQSLMDGQFSSGGNANLTTESEMTESTGRKENKRNRPSRWQDPDPADKILQEKQKQQLQLQSIGFGNFKDQDMRINSNGDVDMRTLNMMSQPKIHPTNIVNPAILAQKPPPAQLLLPNILVPTILQQTALQTALLAQSAARQPETNTVDIEKYKMEAAGMLGKDLAEVAKSDTDIRQLKDVDIRQMKDVDIRQMHDVDIRQLNKFEEDEAEGGGLQIVMEEDEHQDDLVENLPKTQRDLFKRIQAQQKEKTPLDDDVTKECDENDEQEGNIDWYSEDEDDNKLMIEDVKEEEKPVDVDKLGDLSNIDISAEVSKLLSTMKKVEPTRDPRLSTESRDPRRKARSSTEEKSIYEQTAEDIDLRDKDIRTRTDVDLRQMTIPFKGIQNYTPATEIDASINSHPPINWVVYIVEIPKPDYTGLKLSVTEAQTTGDPRLKKIFKLSLEENDSPASPKESPKPPAPAVPRVDPRRRKMETNNSVNTVNPEPQNSMNYNQQLATLQSSPFYQTLTSNQKVILNQELASRNDQSGQNDPLVASILQSLGLISPNPINTPTNQAALNILSNINNLGFPGPNPNLNMGPGLLGPAPPIQNLPPVSHDFFDPRSNILNGPPPNFGGGGNFQGDNFYENDYYPDQGPPQQFNGGNNRDRFRDRPNRRGRNNNRNNRSFFRRHNRNNRNSPP